jgi:hypothetical protein
MKFPLFFTILFLLVATVMGGEAIPMPPSFDIKASERFANLALACVHKEFPNHLSHTLNSDADVQPPRKLTPAFYGCYDWHSSVHGHWLLVTHCGKVSRRKISCKRLHISGERDVPVLSVRMGFHGSFNWLRN